MPRTKIKIVYLIPNLDIGGPQRLILDLAKNLDYSKFDIYIISLITSNSMLDMADYQKYCKIEFCDAPPQRRLRWLNISALKTLYSKIKQINPQIIHSHLWGPTCLYLIAISPFLCRYRIKYFHTIHTSGSYFKYKSLGEYFHLKTEMNLQKITKATTVLISREIAENAISNLKLKRTIFIPNGIDPNIFKKNAKLKKVDYGFLESDIIITFPSRGQESKGHRIAVEMMSLLEEKYPNLKLLFIGDGVEELVNDQIETLHLSSKVICIGKRNDIPELLSISDYGIFPSYYEGMPIALGEMMSCNLPIVASDIPSIREMSLNGEGCLLAQKGSPNDFASKLSILLDSYRQREALSIIAREIVLNNFSIMKNVKLHEAVYISSLLSDKISIDLL